MAVDYKELKKGGFMRQRQKDHFSMRLKSVGGHFTAVQLGTVQKVAEQYGKGYVHLTSRQGIEIPFIRLEDIDAVKNALHEGGVSVGVCGPRVRTITACQGCAVCASGLIDTQHLANEFDKRYGGRELPHKFKFGFTGCHTNCLKAEENDFGVKGGVKPQWSADNCTFCGVCEAGCPEKAITVKADEGKVVLDAEKCVYCGKCINSCPFGAIFENSQVFDVLQRLREGEKIVAVVAPAILGHYNAPTEKVYVAIKAIGFEDVIEVAQGAMETIRNEGAELEEKIEEGQAFMTTSCCPSWVELANKHIPEMKPFISSTGSPMYYAARIAKVKHPDAQVVFIGPCVAKRKEARRDECVDFVMTFEEINSIFDGLGIEVATTDPFPIPFVSTRAAHGFAQAGGVMGAVQLFLADNNRPQVEGIQVSNLNKKKVSLLRAYAKSGKAPAKFIEVMACEGGCITGPSTHNLHDAGKRQFAKELAKR